MAGRCESPLSREAFVCVTGQKGGVADSEIFVPMAQNWILRQHPPLTFIGHTQAP